MQEANEAHNKPPTEITKIFSDGTRAAIDQVLNTAPGLGILVTEVAMAGEPYASAAGLSSTVPEGSSYLKIKYDPEKSKSLQVFWDAVEAQEKRNAVAEPQKT